MRLSADLKRACLTLAGAAAAPRPPALGRRLRVPALAERVLGGLTCLAVEAPVVVQSEANLKQHHMAQYRRFVRQKQELAAYLALLGVPRPVLPLPCRVTFTRLGGAALDDDNLRGAFKGVRDYVAKELLGLDDADPRIEWKYDQRPGGPAGIRVRMEASS
jgi:hypothetical protein